MSSSNEEASSATEPEDSGDDETQNAIRDDLKGMSFEEIMKLKEELGAKVYKEAVLGGQSSKETARKPKPRTELKRLNKNRPREMSSRRQVPFLGADQRAERKKGATEVRDPRFDEKSGTYNADTFKKNYQFVSQIRQKEVGKLKKQLDEVEDPQEKHQIKDTMQRLINKNVEDKRWHTKQKKLKKELAGIQKKHDQGQQPHYLTKKERRAKELVAQFEQLKSAGKLNKHLEKRRKKNAAKDRKRIGVLD
ncbi:hypothetical protein KR067_006314 [Drosophila pandora]|nr:hypothetical protein KR067_006314 [Drosophila pandora]